MKRIFTGFLALLCLAYSPLLAQRETQNWHFGNNAALSFATGGPVALPTSGMVTYEATATVSDPAGNLLFYTNSVNVWNRNHQLMTNGQAMGGHESATQGAVIVRDPGNPTRYYLFVVDGCDNQLVGGLKYSIIDMTQQGGLGAVTSRANQLSSFPVTEKLTAVRHRNGRDTWIVVHGWQNNTFYAYLLSATGLSAPVVTNLGSVHSGGGGSFGNANAVGYLKASPAGNKLALAKRDSNFELYDFNNATGQLSNFVPLTQDYRSYGVEFSPDGSRLYGTTLDGNRIYQYNLLAGSGTAIAASATLVGTTASGSAYAGALQLASDGKIYLAIYNSAALGVINSPNALGAACGYQNNGPTLGGRLSQLGLPNFPNAFVQNEWTGAVSPDYTEAANWSARYVPGSTDDVVIRATATRMPVLTTSAAVRRFTVESGASMTVDGTFAVNGDLVNQGSFGGQGELQVVQAGAHSIGGNQFSIRNLTVGTGAPTTLTGSARITGVLALSANLTTNGNQLTLGSDAAGTAMVVNTGSAEVVGAVTVQRYLAPRLNATLGYRHFSAPVRNTTLGDLATPEFSPVFNPGYNTAAVPGLVTPFPTVYSYDQQRLVTAATLTNTGFVAGFLSPAGPTDAMTPGLGYTVNMGTASPVDFVGTLNNGNLTRGNLLRNTEADGGWHFLGNPYPAPLDWELTYAGATNLLNSVYVFKSTGQYDGSYDSYVNGVGAARYIASSQGFFVRVAAAGDVGSLTFTNAARLTSYLSPEFNRPAAEARPLVQLDLVSGSRHDATHVYFEQGATVGFDAGFDAYKITTGEVPALWVQSTKDALSISGLPVGQSVAGVTVPLGIYVPQAGAYTLQPVRVLNLPAGTTVYLHDNQTGAVVDLQQVPTYTFSTTAALQSTTRFALRFAPRHALASSRAQLEAQVVLFPNPAQEQVSLLLPELVQQPVTLLLINALGQTVREQKVPAGSRKTTPVTLPLGGVAKGVYTLRVRGAAIVISKKLVVE
ncbi:T9SS type A sorting domain-containing protein [Hymenobacter persicinus]|uniref:T9SS type A sorting domain-containing protein n=1 Tax=Hymenobacter persicinus TaxID=2025506 RepID=A0A4Q5LE33_9BACT|nr:T9SS type A sorting domain-containing protein [Hymenobacter persicinus]RYU82396.1 T9SS type A sorting domain-containing protein [Hymenobacter persicinus]